MAKKDQCLKARQAWEVSVLCERPKGHEGMHRSGKRRWKNKEHPKRDEAKFVVYNQPSGRTEVGIYCRHVKIVGDMAFVLPEGSAKHADILPAIHVFEKREEAERYFAGEGKEVWVVNTPGYKQIPEMFKGKIITFCHERFGGRRDRSTLIMRPNESTFSGGYDTRYYTNKKQAEAEFAHRWKRAFKDAKKTMIKMSERLDALLACKPRSRRKET